jgi:glycerol-3-phosphate dehydrogenase (NAD(P)+)
MNQTPQDTKDIAVLGAGSWGTALAVHFAGVGGHRVRLWARDAELARRMAEERTNPEYLPGVELPPLLEPTSDLEDLPGCDFNLLVVPSHGFREVLRQFLRVHPKDRPVPLISGTKGIEIETLARMSQVSFEEGMAADREVRFAVLSGPTFAVELARSMPSAAVIAAEDGGFATEIRESFATPWLRLYSSSDVAGVELGGAVKNVIAVAAGKTLEQITSGTHMVSEGIRNSLAVSRLAAARGVDMPITQQMAAVMYEGKDARKAVEELMTRELKSESEL